MKYWATILDVIEKGIEGDKEGCRAYAELLLERLESEGENQITERLRRRLAGEKGQIIHLATDQLELINTQDEIINAVSQVFGLAFQNIQFGDGTAIPLTPPPSFQGPLVGYGDPVSVEDWVIVTHHWKRDGGEQRQVEENGMPWRITSMSPSFPHTMHFATRHGGFSCNSGTIGRDDWRTFQKVELEQVPFYLREALPLPQGATLSTLRQLTKQQILTKFARQTEGVELCGCRRQELANSYHA